MTEQEAFWSIRNALRLENIGRDVAAKIAPQLLDVYKQAASMISRIDSGDILREQRVRQVLQQLAPLFRGANDQLYSVLTKTLRDEVMREAYEAEKFLKLADANKELKPVGITTLETARSPVASYGKTAEGYSATLKNTVTSALGPGNFELGSAVTRTQLMALTDETEVLGERLSRLFGVDGDESSFINSQIKTIDRTVKQGFLAGETNEEIARNIVQVAGRRANVSAKAIARTAVMDMSQRAHERMWDENAVIKYMDEKGQPKEYRVIELWEYDATFDYRVCPLCYPYDGKRAKKRSDLPEVPRHPNCRCRIIPVTKTSLALEKQDIKDGITLSTVQVGQPLKSHGPVRKYKTKARFRKTVKGKQKTVTRAKFAQDIEVPVGERPSMGFFLLRANNETREAVLGKKNAKRFFDMVRTKDGNKAVLEANEALRKIVSNPA